MGRLLPALAAGASLVTAGPFAVAPPAPPAVREGRIAQHGSHPSRWKATIAYPVVVGRSPAIRRMNVTLRGQAKAAVADFVHELPTVNAPARDGVGASSTIQTTIQTDILTSRLAGFTADTYTFPAGAAHGVALVTTSTFNVATGSRWHLPGLFRPGSRYLAFLSRESRVLLRRQFSPAVDPTSALDQGTTPNLVNFQAWAVTPFGLELTFSSYQVGPYAIGTPSVLIPFARLARLTRPGGPIALAEADRPARTPLLPATRPPAVDECDAPAPRQGSFPRPVCAGGKVNVAAWNLFAAYGLRLLRLGPAARTVQVRDAACADEARLGSAALVRSAERVAAAYNGWRFLTSPLANFPANCPRRR